MAHMECSKGVLKSKCVFPSFFRLSGFGGNTRRQGTCLLTLWQNIKIAYRAIYPNIMGISPNKQKCLKAREPVEVEMDCVLLASGLDFWIHTRSLMVCIYAQKKEKTISLVLQHIKPLQFFILVFYIEFKQCNAQLSLWWFTYIQCGSCWRKQVIVGVNHGVNNIKEGRVNG